MCSSAAARVKLPARARARNARMCRRSWIIESAAIILIITEIRTIQLSNSAGGVTVNFVPIDNCIPFTRSRSRTGKAKPPARAVDGAGGDEVFDHLTPAQCAFLSGVLAILAAHGQDALTRSCEMVIRAIRARRRRLTHSWTPLSKLASTATRARVSRRSAITELPLNLVFFGPPGAGKGTQADRFAHRHGIPKISTGDMLRQAVQDGTRLGNLVRETLQSGGLVGDDLMISLVTERLEQRDTAHGFVLDGFPRTLPQAAALDDFLSDRGGVAVVALVVHVDEVIRRLSGRGRDDDAAYVIKERLAVYARETQPVLEYYRRRGVVTVLDGNRPAGRRDGGDRDAREQGKGSTRPGTGMGRDWGFAKLASGP